MGSPVVINASPLIFLAGANLLQFLTLAGDPVIVPHAVFEEINRFGPNDVTASSVRNAKWLTIADSDYSSPVVERWDLGVGESAVLAWAHAHPGTIALLDDLAARRCASTLNIPVLGTLGLILIAKRRNIISEARPILENLRESGMYLSPQILDQALKLVGE